MKINKETDKILELFRKVIASLACILFKMNDENKIINVQNIMNDLIEQYDNYNLNHDVNLISFIYSSKEIDDFCNECYEDVELCIYAEDLEFGYTELIEKIIKERGV